MWRSGSTSQRHFYCRLDPGLPLKTALWMPSLALADFPALLTGEWPPENALEAALAVVGSG